MVTSKYSFNARASQGNGSAQVQTFRLLREAEGFPEKIRICLPKGAELIGGAYGRNLSRPEKNAVARALHDIFSPRGEKASIDDYIRELERHESEFNHSYIMAEGKLGWKAVLLLKQGNQPIDSKTVADDNGFWMRDDPKGEYLLFRKNIPDIISNQEVRKTLIEAAKAYAKPFIEAGIVRGLLGFTRPFDYDKCIKAEDYWEKSSDTNILLYRGTNAKLIKHFEGGCPQDAKAGGLMFMFSY